jgi:periplasmic protein TonB
MSDKRGQVPANGLGILNGCLVEGDPEQRARERKTRRRAFVLSVTLQGLVLAAIILVPLFGKTARIAFANVMPLPPYYSRPAPRHTAEGAATVRPARNVCRFCPGRSIPNTIATHDLTPPDDGGSAPIEGGIEIPGALPPPDSRAVPMPQPPPVEQQTPHVVHITHINPALLTHRVEPVYPTLPRQLARSGRVELRAIIGTDGTIQSLEVVGGDPMFYSSAMEAVRQWRYTPTMLNGRQVEVDTYITIIYNMQR